MDYTKQGCSSAVDTTKLFFHTYNKKQNLSHPNKELHEL